MSYALDEKNLAQKDLLKVMYRQMNAFEKERQEKFLTSARIEPTGSVLDYLCSAVRKAQRKTSWVIKLLLHKLYKEFTTASNV